MNFLEYIGVPTIASYIIIGFLIVLSCLPLYFQIKNKFSKKCRNCGKKSGRQILCDKCYDQNKDLFPHEWENKK